MLEDARKIMASMAKILLEAAQDGAEGDWEKAYMNFECGDGFHFFSASFARAGRGVLMELDPLDPAAELGDELWDELVRQGHPFKVLLLTVSPNGSYEVDFERHNAKRWQIRLDEGYDGIPRD